VILTSPSQAVRVITSGATNVTVYATYVDRGVSIVPGVTDASISSATTTSVLSGSSTYPAREVTSIHIANTDASASQTITLEYYNGSAARQVWKGVVGPGERVRYDAYGIVLFNSSGVPKTAPVVGPNYSSVLACPLFATANLTGVRSITSTNTYAVYLGRSPRNLTSVNLRYRVTTGAATITWAELAVAKGSVSIGAGPTLTVVGYADVSGTVTGTGQFTTAVNVSSGQSIVEGDDLWALYGNNASTVTVLRAQSIADDLQSGVFAYLSTRPSTNVGNAQAYTIDGATSIAPWIVAVV
jgi:hypothetical protein